MISLKSVPTGRPGLVQPSLHKIDAAALKRDLKKFEENYPERVSQVWAQWLQDLDKLLELPTEWVWPLEVLEKCQKIRPSNEDVAVPSTLQAMRDKETEATEQVCLRVCVFFPLSQNEMKLFTKRCALEFNNCRMLAHNIYNM